jgi:hypothetical protein
MHKAPRGGEHQSVAEKPAGDQAEAAEQTAEQCPVDDAERRDHSGLRDRQHQIGPNENNTCSPCPGLILAEHQEGVIGVLNCGAGAQHQGDNADRNWP